MKKKFEIGFFVIATIILVYTTFFYQFHDLQDYWNIYGKIGMFILAEVVLFLIILAESEKN